MHETSELESFGRGHRTFDCPWCGAICGIDPNHIGEHFECPECRTTTKLTPQNTRGGHATQAPPDAPHHEEGEAGTEGKAASPPKPRHGVSGLESYGKGHRTFDCPWCGAIAGIDPSHLGESFTCPECHKPTKLTPQNTRSADLAEPPPGAPHHEEKSSKALLVGIVAALVVVVVVIAVVAGSGGEGKENGERAALPPRESPTAPPVEPGTTPPSETVPPESTPPEEVPPPGETPPSETVPPESTPPGEVAPPGETPPPETAPPQEQPPAETPPDAVQEAEAVLAKAKADLAAWVEAHPEVAATLALLNACNDMRTEANRLCEGLPAAEATPEQARRYNEAVRTFVAADPKRIEAAQRVADRLNRDRLKPLFLGSWKDVNFFLPQVRRTMSVLEDEGACVESVEYGALLRKVKEAEAALEAASGS